MINFSSSQDLLSLHYDHAPDKDDGHATVAGKVLVDTYEIDHVVVGGAHGKNADSYNPASEQVMDATWGIGGWINANDNRGAAIQELGETWLETIQNGGQVFVAEGGQADTSLGAARYVENNGGDAAEITIVQHSSWNLNQYGDGVFDALDDLGVKQIRLDDGNRTNDTADLNTTDSSVSSFVDSALTSQWSEAWEAAFDYFNPEKARLDFSDTVEALHILDVGLSQVADPGDFADLYLEGTETPELPDPPANSSAIRIEAENYDSGGQNVSFYDTTAQNFGDSYRNDAVDIQPTTDVGGGYNVGWIQSGEWLTYDNFAIPEDGLYDVVARVATPKSGKRNFTVTVDNQVIPFELGHTGSWQSWEDVVVEDVYLEAGTPELRVDLLSDDFNLNYLELIPTGEDDLLGSPPTVGLSVVDTDQDTVIGTVAPGGTIDLATVGSSVSIRADFNEPVDQVNFQLDGPVSINQTEQFVPYALGGDRSGDYKNAGLVEGDYTLTVTGYDLEGQAYQPVTTDFSVI